MFHISVVMAYNYLIGKKAALNAR